SCFCKHEPHARHRNDAICYRAKQSFIALSHEILPPPPPIPLESSEDTGKALALGDDLRYFASVRKNWTHSHDRHLRSFVPAGSRCRLGKFPTQTGRVRSRLSSHRGAVCAG